MPEIALYLARRGAAALGEDRGGAAGDRRAAALLGLRLGRRPGARPLRPRQSQHRRRQERARRRLRLRPCRHRRGEGRRERRRGDARSMRSPAPRSLANAAANRVALTISEADPIGSDRGWEIVLVGDAFYEKPLADRLLPWLETLAGRGATILHRRSRPHLFPKEPLRASRRIFGAGHPRARGQRDQEDERVEASDLSGGVVAPRDRMRRRSNALDPALVAGGCAARGRGDIRRAAWSSSRSASSAMRSPATTVQLS